MVRSNLDGGSTQEEALCGRSVAATVIRRNIKCAGGVILHLLDRSFALDPL